MRSLLNLLLLAGAAFLALGRRTHAAETSVRGKSGPLAACRELKETFPSQRTHVLLPRLSFYLHTAITNAVPSVVIWSETCLATPSCVFLPHSAQDVSSAIQIVHKSHSPFAVLGGGHMPIPGAASTNSGVLISLHKLNTLSLVNEGKTIQVGPGNHWSDVYNYTSQFSLAVNGGRYGQVGVGGLLLGGGIGYFSSQTGWAADSVTQYEIVLANGTIALVNAHSEPDLFWALKGGGNYFGIVTRFDLATIPAPAGVYTGITLWEGTPSAVEAWLAALGAYLAPGRGSGIEDPLAALSPTVAMTPHNGTYEVMVLKWYGAPDPAPRAFENFSTSAIRGPTLQDRGGLAPWNYLSQQLDSPAYAARDRRQLFFAVSFKPDERAIGIANRTVFARAGEELRDVRGGTITLAYQPISRAWLEASKRAGGGGALGLEPEDGPFIASIISTAWEDAADDELVLTFNREVVASINEQNSELGLDHPFVYMNDAGPDQDPYASYGEASLERLRRIQRAVDEDGVLRNQLAHGFDLF
ncbi:hypothetical protein HK57_00223 [Aspergillus ustus]|uniref:FAD-binding PCMH-type domain-containing protein n=1 Tax=Aspergillus ustus TaxID=40382 RepID=A0A0C1C4D2_ASPUT|nr:hypothetical protein HK57_00223 [Aspergillus ustus]